MSPWLDIIQFEDGAPWGRRNVGPLHDMLDWVIAGGESGPCARPMQPDWARSLRDQCIAASVPFFFKQWGGVGKAKAGRLLDGLLHDAYPQAPMSHENPLRNLLAMSSHQFVRD